MIWCLRSSSGKPIWLNRHSLAADCRTGLIVYILTGDLNPAAGGRGHPLASRGTAVRRRKLGMLIYLGIVFTWVAVIRCLQLEPSWERLPVKTRFDEKRVSMTTAVLRFFKFKESWLIIVTVPLAVMARAGINYPLTWKDILVGAVPIAIWPLVEWVTHVYILHRFPGSNLHHDHAEHHKRPAIAQSSLHRPYTTVTYWLIIFTLWYWQLPLLSSFWISAMVLMTTYEIFHFVTHSPVYPRWAFLRKRVSNHRRHHWVDEDTCFGVLTLSSDRFLATDHRPRRKKTVR